MDDDDRKRKREDDGEGTSGGEKLVRTSRHPVDRPKRAWGAQINLVHGDECGQLVFECAPQPSTTRASRQPLVAWGETTLCDMAPDVLLMMAKRLDVVSMSYLGMTCKYLLPVAQRAYKEFRRMVMRQTNESPQKWFLTWEIAKEHLPLAHSWLRTLDDPRLMTVTRRKRVLALDRAAPAAAYADHEEAFEVFVRRKFPIPLDECALVAARQGHVDFLRALGTYAGKLGKRNPVLSEKVLLAAATNGHKCVTDHALYVLNYDEDAGDGLTYDAASRMVHETAIAHGHIKYLDDAVSRLSTYTVAAVAAKHGQVEILERMLRAGQEYAVFRDAVAEAVVEGGHTKLAPWLLANAIDKREPRITYYRRLIAGALVFYYLRAGEKERAREIQVAFPDSGPHAARLLGGHGHINLAKRWAKFLPSPSYETLLLGAFDNMHVVLIVWTIAQGATVEMRHYNSAVYRKRLDVMDILLPHLPPSRFKNTDVEMLLSSARANGIEGQVAQWMRDNAVQPFDCLVRAIRSWEQLHAPFDECTVCVTCGHHTDSE